MLKILLLLIINFFEQSKNFKNGRYIVERCMIMEHYEHSPQYCFLSYLGNLCSNIEIDEDNFFKYRSNLYKLLEKPDINQWLKTTDSRVYIKFIKCYNHMSEEEYDKLYEEQKQQRKEEEEEKCPNMPLQPEIFQKYIQIQKSIIYEEQIQRYNAPLNTQTTNFYKIIKDKVEEILQKQQKDEEDEKDEEEHDFFSFRPKQQKDEKENMKKFTINEKLKMLLSDKFFEAYIVICVLYITLYMMFHC